MFYVDPPNSLEEIRVPMERKLKSDAPEDLKAIIEVLRANAGNIVDQWAVATAQSSYIKAKDFDQSDVARIDRLRAFFNALVEKAESPASKKAHETMKSEVRTEHSRSLGLATIVKKQNLLREIMFRVVEKELPELPPASAKLAIDMMIDKSVEGIVIMLEEFSEMQLSLSRSNQVGAGPSFSVDHALSKFCKNAMDYFDVDFVALFRYLSLTRELECQACAAKGITLTRDSRINVDSFPLAGEAFKKKGTVVAGAKGPEEGARHKVVGQIAFARSVCVPLMTDENPIGLLVLGDNTRMMSMTADEVSLLEDLVDQVASVLKSSDAFDELNLRSRAQKSLIDTAALLQQDIESEEIYRIIGTRLSEIIPCDEFAFYVFDWPRRTASPVYATGPYAAEVMADRDFSADVGFVGFVAKSREAEIIFDTETDPRGNYIPGTPNAHTRMMVVPVIGQKEVLGVLELLRYFPDTFSPEDLEIATLFANHAAVALENAHLLKEVMGARDQIEMTMDLLTHDIANHTTPMMAYIETLKNKPALDEDVSTVLDRLAVQLDSMNRLVDMVRTLSKLRAPGPRVLGPTDLNAAVRHGLDETRKAAGDKVLGFSVSLPTYELKVKADEMLNELFANLFLSAVQSVHEETVKVIVTAEPRKERKSEYWLIKVSQPNRNIPDNMKSEILKMSIASKSELSGGYGIGLAVARGIVDRYAGNMWVSDIVPGDSTKGCSFNIMLPKAV